MDKLLQNAIDSIEIGIEDFKLSTQDERRIISCARNIFSGILLLFKYKLSQFSPDLIVSRVGVKPTLNNGKFEWTIKVPEHGNTVDYQEIKDRLKALQIDLNWAGLDDLRIYRNEIEHYHSTISLQSLQEKIAKTFELVRYFIIHELEMQPEEIFKKQIWDILVCIHTDYETEKEKSIDELKQLDFYHEEIFNTISNHSCTDCGYDLITVQVHSKENHSADCASYLCKSCLKTWNYDDLIEGCLGKKYKLEWWDYGRYGAEPPVVDCPECGGQYDCIEKFCYNCDSEIQEICLDCGNSISASELEYAGFCGSCFYLIEKLSDE